MAWQVRRREKGDGAVGEGRGQGRRAKVKILRRSSWGRVSRVGGSRVVGEGGDGGLWRDMVWSSVRVG